MDIAIAQEPDVVVKVDLGRKGIVDYVGAGVVVVSACNIAQAVIEPIWDLHFRLVPVAGLLFNIWQLALGGLD